MKTKYFISKAVPGLILNLDNILYISYLENLERLWIYFNQLSQDGHCIYKEFKGEPAKNLYNEIIDFLK